MPRRSRHDARNLLARRRERRDLAASEMPTTRAPAAAAAERQLILLPADILSLVLYQLPLAHDIAAVAPTCHTLCDAAKLAMKLRPFTGEVVTLAGHTRPPSWHAYSF